MAVNLSADKSLDRLPVDMTDIYFICAGYQRAVDSFLSLPDEPSSREALDVISELEQHLYYHLPYHYKPFAKGLSKLKRAIEPDEHKREQIASEALHALSRKVAKAARRAKPSGRRRTRQT